MHSKTTRAQADLRQRHAQPEWPVNVIDKPAFCDFSFGAIVNRSPLVIGISTDGAAPVFAQAIRAKLEASAPQKGSPNGPQRQRVGAIRVEGSGLSFSGRRKFWQVFTAHAVTNPESEPTSAISSASSPR